MPWASDLPARELPVITTAEWLNSKGIAGLVLKYRTLQTMPANGRGRGAPPGFAGTAAEPRKELEIRNGK